MSVKRRQFTSQFKAKVAMEAMKGQRTIGELAGMYQVHPSRIAAWKKHLVEYSAMAFEESSVQGSDRSSPALMAQLYEQIGRLQVELSWLKKVWTGRLIGSVRRWMPAILGCRCGGSVNYWDYPPAVGIIIGFLWIRRI